MSYVMNIVVFIIFVLRAKFICSNINLLALLPPRTYMHLVEHSRIASLLLSTIMGMLCYWATEGMNAFPDPKTGLVSGIKLHQFHVETQDSVLQASLHGGHLFYLSDLLSLPPQEPSLKEKNLVSYKTKYHITGNPIPYPTLPSPSWFS
jgi:hypothetical protein